MKTYLAVFAGLRQGRIDPLIAEWVKLSEDGSELAGDSIWFTAKKKTKLNGKGVWIGDVYEVIELEDEGGTFRIEKPRVKSWDDSELCSRWRMEERAAEAGVAADKLAAKATFGDLTLDQAREQYRKTIGSARRVAILSTIIQHVTG